MMNSPEGTYTCTIWSTEEIRVDPIVGCSVSTTVGRTVAVGRILASGVFDGKDVLVSVGSSVLSDSNDEVGSIF
jgi:hypothetical protein